MKELELPDIKGHKGENRSGKEKDQQGGFFKMVSEDKQDEACSEMNGFSDQVPVDKHPRFYPSQDSDYQDIQKEVYENLIIHIFGSNRGFRKDR
jgi:hypothetical protein